MAVAQNSGRPPVTQADLSPPVATRAPVPRVGRGTALRVSGPTAGYMFGTYPRGKVIPIWEAEKSHIPAEELVRRGWLEWTDDLPVGNFEPPKPKSGDGEEAVNASNAMAEELNRLRKDVLQYRADSEILHKRNLAFETQVGNQLVQLGEQAEQIVHWRTLAEGYKTQVEQLTGHAEDLKQANESLTLSIAAHEKRIEELLEVPAPARDTMKGKNKNNPAPPG
jgi:hypothetical protein